MPHQNWDGIAKLLKPVHTAPTDEERLGEFTSFLRLDTEIRRIASTTKETGEGPGPLDHALVYRAERLRRPVSNHYYRTTCLAVPTLRMSSAMARCRAAARWWLSAMVGSAAASSPQTSAAARCKAAHRCWVTVW